MSPTPQARETPESTLAPAAKTERRLARVAWCLHALVAAAFAVAGALKLGDLARFATDIGHYRLVSPLMAGLAAAYLPWLELTLAAGLLAARTRPAARWLAAALLGVFCLALASVLARGIDLRCGCFGAAAETGAGGALARNLVLIAVLLVAARLEKRATR
jgi:hypothetical protein